MLQAYVIEHLKLRWSPEQIAATLKHDYPHDEDMRVSHETIYKSLFIQARGALKKDLVVYLRSKRSVRRPKRNPQKDTQQGSIVDGISIRERPAEVEDRAVPGHWEGDLIEGKKGTHIATLVERQSRFVILVKVANKETETVVQAVVEMELVLLVVLVEPVVQAVEPVPARRGLMQLCRRNPLSGRMVD